MIVVSEAVTDSHEEPVCSLSAIPSHPLRPPNSTPGLSMLHSDTWARGPAGQWASARLVLGKRKPRGALI